MPAQTKPFQPSEAFLLRAATGMDTKSAAAAIGIKASALKRLEDGREEASPEILEALRKRSRVPARPEPGKFTFIDLFAGIGGMRRAFEGAGGECVFTAEWNKYALETYVANHGADHPIVGDITQVPADQVPDHDVLVGGFPCFPAGTLIETQSNFVPIEEIRKGDMVATHERRLRRVLNVMRRNGAALLEVKVTGVPSFRTTHEHPFYVRKRTRVWNNARRRYEHEFGAPEWVEAGNLTGDHFAALPMDDVGEQQEVRTPEFWYMVGRWLGDGWIVSHPRTEKGREHHFIKKALICTGSDDADALRAAIIAAGFNPTAAAERTVVKFHISSHALVDFLADFGRGAKGKQIPRRIFSEPLWVQEAIWNGWIDSDGYKFKGKEKWAGTSVNRAMSLQMARLARNVFGKVACVGRGSVPAKTVIEGRTVNQSTQYRTTLATQNHGLTFIEGGFAWVKVKWVKPTGETATVHNIEVEEDNSYVAEGVVVHNCQPFSLAGVSKKNSLGRAHGFADETQGTLFFDVARIIETKRPRMFLLENVKNLCDHDKGRTFEIILRTLSQELGYTVSYQVIDGSAWVPQKRKRIFIVGVREGEAFDFSDVVIPDKGPVLGDILHRAGEIGDGGRYSQGGAALPKYTLTDNLWRYLQDYAAKHAKAGNGFGFGLVGPGDVARTLSARYGKDGSEILVRQADGKNPRRLTPRECARLQGFDTTGAEIFIPVSDAQAYRQFGNSVVVPGVSAIAKAMVPYLEAVASLGVKVVPTDATCV